MGFFYVQFHLTCLMSVVVSSKREAFFFYVRFCSLVFICYSAQLKREKNKKHIEHFDKVSHDVHWRWCLVFWSLCLWPDGGLQHTQSHFVLARKGPAAHLASGHAPWKKGILYGEDRGIVPRWCMWLLVCVCGCSYFAVQPMRCEVLADSLRCTNLKNNVFVLKTKHTGD